MELDVKPIHKNGYNCVEDSIASVASWWNRDHRMIFKNAWSFCYSGSENKIGERIKIIDTIGDEDNRDFHGIDFSIHKDETAENGIKIIEDELKNERLVFIF